MAASFDIGVGRVTGFFTNGRKDVIPAIDRALVPVAGLGPFAQSEEAMTGTRQRGRTPAPPFRREVEAIVEGTALKEQMQAFDLYEDYRAGRGRRP
ncbi:MAG TPA: hypothetical protein VGB42_13180 [Candidatus Thermoplasmatota archaeon]